MCIRDRYKPYARLSIIVSSIIVSNKKHYIKTLIERVGRAGVLMLTLKLCTKIIHTHYTQTIVITSYISSE